jgi:hypothetical protein
MCSPEPDQLSSSYLGPMSFFASNVSIHGVLSGVTVRYSSALNALDLAHLSLSTTWDLVSSTLAACRDSALWNVCTLGAIE